MRKAKLFGMLTILVIAILSAAPVIAFKGIHGDAHANLKHNYDSLFSAAEPLERSAEARQLIESLFDRYGGREHLAELETIELHYRMISSLSGDTTSYEKWAAPGRRFKMSNRGRGIDKVRYLHEASAWRSVGDKLEAVDADGYCAILFGYLTLQMPLAIETEPFSEIRFGTREADSLAYLYMKKDDSLMIVLGVDPESSLISSSEGVVYVDNGYQVYVNLFDDYRKVDGYLLPHRLTSISLGLTVGRAELDSVQVNHKLVDKAFKPAASIRTSY